MEIKRSKVKDLLGMEAGREVLAKGWVRTKRPGKEVAFIALNDGSTIRNIQVVVDRNGELAELLPKISTGTCIAVRGTLVESVGSGQAVEIKAEGIARWPTSAPGPIPSARCTGFAARWPLPSMSTSIPGASCI